MESNWGVLHSSLEGCPEDAAVFCQMLGADDVQQLKARQIVLARIESPLASQQDHLALSAQYFSEAVAFRSATIPPNAFVDVEITPFVGCHLREQREGVYFAWEQRNPGGLTSFCLFRINLTIGNIRAFSLGPELNEELRRINLIDRATPEGLAEFKRRCTPEIINLIEQVRSGWSSSNWSDVITALTAVSMAIVRDFWIVEDRENAFRLGPPRTRLHRDLNGEATSSRIVYLPRCRYSKVQVEATRADRAKEWSCEKHLVRSHFRKLSEGQKASGRQKAIASIHGVEIPVGCTWVKGHFSGTNTAARVYRSRTAVSACLEVVSQTHRHLLAGLTWFAFERLCDKLMQDRGYKVVTKVGDNGIDILAVNTVGEYVLVQCKHQAKSVGPGIVRELVGARERFRSLHGHVAETLIASSSGFSVNARIDASRSGIECVLVN